MWHIFINGVIIISVTQDQKFYVLSPESQNLSVSSFHWCWLCLHSMHYLSITELHLRLRPLPLPLRRLLQLPNQYLMFLHQFILHSDQNNIPKTLKAFPYSNTFSGFLN